MGNFSGSRTIITGDQIRSFAAANAVGGGFDAAAKSTIHISKVNGEIITTILVDLQGLVVSGTVLDVIGENDTAASYLTSITTTKNGIVYIAAGGAWTAGMYKATTAGTDFSALVGDYLYLSNGSGANTGGTYTAGKFIIKLFGASF